MNNLKEKIKNYFQKGKKSGIEVITYLAFLIVVVVNVGISFSNPDRGLIPNQSVEGLSFENAILKVENGISKYTVEVINDLSEAKELKTIEIVLKNPNGDVITNLIGYIGDRLDSGESKVLEASIDEEITTIPSVEYHINK